MNTSNQRPAYAVSSIGILMIVLGIICVWAGLGLPGTEGAGVYPWADKMAIGAGIMAFGFGGLVLEATSLNPRQWAYWLAILLGLGGALFFFYSFAVRSQELGYFF